MRRFRPRRISDSAVLADTESGYALQTYGRLKLNDTSGVAIIPIGSTSITVAPPVDLTESSFVLLTPRANLNGRDLWFSVDTTADALTIRISSSRANETRISWLLLG